MTSVRLTAPLDAARVGWQRLVDTVGGPARMRVVLVLAGVLGLDGADKGTVSATADNLERAFHIGNTEIGVLVSATTAIGALATLPVGVLTDRIRRTRLLALSIGAWAIAMLFAGIAQSYLWLLVARLGLGIVTATAGPTLASLTGDFFPAKARARMYGFILAGELIGTGFGFVVSGYLAAHLSWRWAFFWLILPSAGLLVAMLRLPEPARGGQSRLQEGQEDIPDEDEVTGHSDEQRQQEEQQALEEAREGVATQAIEKKGVEPDPRLVLHRNPRNENFWWAVRYILRIRTDVVIIIASALGYFYFTGVRTFGLIFAQGHYGLSKSTATTLTLLVGIGSLVGVYLGGRIADRLTERGVVSGRVIVPAIVLLTIPVFLGPAFWTTSVWLAVPLLMVGAALLGSANPPQDAARLDIIHPYLWGRSEGVRTTLRLVCEASAPVTFGWVSDHVFGGKVGFGGSTGGAGGTAQAQGLGPTFLLFLAVLLAAGLTVLIGVRTYPRDVATATASVENTLGKDTDESAPDAGGSYPDDSREGSGEAGRGAGRGGDGRGDRASPAARGPSQRRR